MLDAIRICCRRTGRPALAIAILLRRLQPWLVASTVYRRASRAVRWRDRFERRRRQFASAGLIAPPQIRSYFGSCISGARGARWAADQIAEAFGYRSRKGGASAWPSPLS
jgi:hypothetical protein